MPGGHAAVMVPFWPSRESRHPMPALPQSADHAPRQSAPTGLRRFVPAAMLLLVAAFHAWDGVSGVASLFAGDASRSGLAAGLSTVYLAARPVLAVAAIGLVLLGRSYEAIVALGTIQIMSWLAGIPSLGRDGFDLRNAFAAMETVLFHVVFPLAAACAVALGARSQRLGLAALLVALLVALPVVYAAVSVVGFTISVIKYGF